MSVVLFFSKKPAPTRGITTKTASVRQKAPTAIPLTVQKKLRVSGCHVVRASCETRSPGCSSSSLRK